METLGEAFINALLIVLVLCITTFGIVLLYRYRCMMCLKGYMVFGSTIMLVSLLLDLGIRLYERLDFTKKCNILFNE